MTKLFLFLALACLVVAPMAEEIMLSRDAETGLTIVADNLRDRSNASLTLQCNIRSFFVEEVENEYGRFTKVEVPGWVSANKVGEADIPVLNKIVEVPFGGAVHAQVVSNDRAESACEEYGIYSAIYPAQESVRKDQVATFAYNEEAYKESYSRADIVTVEEIGIMRGARLVLLTVAPIQYNAADQMLTVNNNVEIELTVDDVDWTTTEINKEQYASSYFYAASESILTAESLKVTPRADANYLMIADPMFKSSAKLAEFVAWKKQLGFNVKLVYTDATGATNDALQAYIKAQYKEFKPTFALLIGDHGQIPGWYKQFYTDLYYFTVDGTDYIPDIMYGRFSANNEAELIPQIEKTMAYEKRQFADPAYLNRFALVAGWDANWAKKRGYPQIRYAIREYFKAPEYVAAEHGVNVFLSAGSQQNVNTIFNLVNSGVGFYNYTAHGDKTMFYDPKFTNDTVDKLTNKNMYPVVLGNCCLTGSYQIDTCFGEKWLRAKDKGAVCFIGGSSYTYWDEDLWFGVGACTITSAINNGEAPAKAETGDGAYEAAVNGMYNRCNDAVIYAGNLAVQATNSSRKEYYWKVYHLFGDPSVKPAWAHK